MRALAPLVALLLVSATALVAAHAERPTESPARPGAVPDPDRAPTAVLDVCKTFVDGEPECAFRHIQDAVNAAPAGALVRVWPGTYLEEPSRAAPSLPPDEEGHYTYEHHVLHPNSQNLVAIVGKPNLTLRGMGDDPRDVVIDVGFAKHVGVRADRSDGVVLQNFAIYHAYDHNVYVLDQAGFLVEDVVSGWAYKYSFLFFAVDHGLVRDCEAFGAGDAGVYPGGTANTPGRWSVEVTGCRSHHNVLGYSGTQGDYVWVHDNVFEDNGLGIVSDSETDHPNYPQKGSRFERNVIRSNNFNVYDGDCSDGACSDVRPTVFVGGILLPVGTGLFLASNNDNAVVDNVVYGNAHAGVWLASGQGIVIGPTSDPPAAPFVSSGNRFLGNVMVGPGGETNGVDFAWDGLGVGNCWQGNVGASGAPTSDTFLPPCDPPVPAGVPNAQNVAQQAGLVYVEDADGRNHPLCHRLGTSPCAGGDVDVPEGLPAAARNTPEGYVPEVAAATCGPSSDPSCWS